MLTRRTDARRRRVLSEEFVPTEQCVAGDDTCKPMHPYSYGANRRNQPKTTDLIPKRLRAVGLFLAFIAGCIVLLNVMAIYAGPISKVIGEKGGRAIALGGSGTIANWFCCACLLMSSAVCLQLFKLRQHKRDDYGGMYKVWLLMAILFLLASLDCAVDLRTMAANAFEYFTHRSLMQTPWLMMTIEMIVLGLLILRMLFEVRISSVSLLCVTMVWAGFVSCIVIRNMGLPEQLAFVDSDIAYGNAILIGCAGVLVSLTTYARFVYLHAHGFVKIATKTKKVKQPKAASKKKEKKKAAKPPKAKTTTAASKEKKAAASKPAPAKKSEVKKPATPKVASSTPKTKPAPAAKTKPAPAPKVAKPVAKTSATPKAKPATKPAPLAAKMKQAAKQQVTYDADTELDYHEEDESILKMSKSERRRQRKLARRAKKAA